MEIQDRQQFKTTKQMQKNKTDVLKIQGSDYVKRKDDNLKWLIFAGKILYNYIDVSTDYRFVYSLYNLMIQEQEHLWYRMILLISSILLLIKERNTRGRGQPIRFLLEYLELPYTEKVYNRDEDKKHEWFQKDKFNINLPYPNVPYIFYGDFKLSQSIAIMSYLPLKSKYPELVGKNQEDQARVQQLMNFIQDYRVHVRNFSFNKQYPQGSEAVYEQAVKFIKQLDETYSRQDYLINNYLTICDFFLYEYFHSFRALFPEKSQQFKNIIAFQERFENIPKINQYIQTKRYQQYISLFPNAAAFNGAQYISELNDRLVQQKPSL